MSLGKWSNNHPCVPISYNSTTFHLHNVNLWKIFRQDLKHSDRVTWVFKIIQTTNTMCINFKFEADGGVGSVINTSLWWVFREILAGSLQLEIRLCGFLQFSRNQGWEWEIKSFYFQDLYLLSPIFTPIQAFTFGRMLHEKKMSLVTVSCQLN